VQAEAREHRSDKKDRMDKADKQEPLPALASLQASADEVRMVEVPLLPLEERCSTVLQRLEQLY
jgi:hypothetical protein